MRKQSGCPEGSRVGEPGPKKRIRHRRMHILRRKKKKGKKNDSDFGRCLEVAIGYVRMSPGWMAGRTEASAVESMGSEHV